jgi:hypothetical protein
MIAGLSALAQGQMSQRWCGKNKIWRNRQGGALLYLRIATLRLLLVMGCCPNYGFEADLPIGLSCAGMELLVPGSRESEKPISEELSFERRKVGAHIRGKHAVCGCDKYSDRNCT